MLEMGDFIGNYRVIMQVVHKNPNNIYLAEHTFNRGSLVLITHWPRTTFAADKDAEILPEKIRGCIIRDDTQSIDILDVGMYHQSPYIVTENRALVRPLLEARAEYVQRVVDTTKIGRSNNPYSIVDVFVQALLFGTKLPKRKTASRKLRGAFLAKVPKRRIYQIICGVLALALLVGSTAFLRIALPADAATLTITPMSKQIAHTYKVNVVHENDKLQPGTIKGHELSYKTAEHSKTVAVTGKGHSTATKAYGKVIVSQIHLFSASDNDSTVEESILDMGQGVSISISSFTAHEGGSVTLDADAVDEGAAGNVAAHSLDGPVDIYSDSEFAITLPGQGIGTAYLENPAKFSGGRDARDYTYVQQSDIDNVSHSFGSLLTPDAKLKANQLIKIKPDEQLVQPITCITETRANHKVNAEASNVTVTVDIKCSAEAYRKQDLLDAAISAHKADALVKFGHDYLLAGDVTTGKPTLKKVDENGLAYYEVPTNGIWFFDINAAQQHKIALSIAGRPQKDATNLLSQGDFKGVKIDTSISIGSALPISIAHIKFSVIPISGLKQGA